MTVSIDRTTEWIVCGWYTPDYRDWWDRLSSNLGDIGAPSDFVERSKSDGGWEINTMRKPHELLAAMDRHPEKTIVFLDVDCAVIGGKAGLAELASISGDIAFFVRSKWSQNSGRPVFTTRSGTFVVRPTRHARAFVNAWCEAGRSAPRYAVDQDSLLAAVGRTPGVSITYLYAKYCAVPQDNCSAPVILHDSASLNSKTSKVIKRLSRLTYRLMPDRASPAQ